MGNTQLMSIKLPRHLGAKVARLAKRQGKTRSQVVRDALEADPASALFDTIRAVMGELDPGCRVLPYLVVGVTDPGDVVAPAAVLWTDVRFSHNVYTNT